jgi:hypothetical protein
MNDPLTEAAYSRLPEHRRAEMQLYLEQGVRPGRFLTAVLCNDYMDLCAQADRAERDFLSVYSFWLYSYAPQDSYGSKEKFNSWLEGRKRDETPKQG